MAAGRIYTPEEKLKIVLEGMSGTISVSDLCRKYDLKPARFYYWKDQLLINAHIHFINEPDSKILVTYRGIKTRSGSDKAKINAAIHNLRAIYYMF